MPSVEARRDRRDRVLRDLHDEIEKNADRECVEQRDGVHGKAPGARDRKAEENGEAGDGAPGDAEGGGEDGDGQADFQ